jgi:hypothetical protein
VGRLDTWYCDLALIASGCAFTGISIAPQQTAIRMVKTVWLVLWILNCVVMFVSLLNFHDDTLETGQVSPP